MIKFHCSICEKKVGVPEEYAGKLIKCPKCANPIKVPVPNLKTPAASDLNIPPENEAEPQTNTDPDQQYLSAEDDSSEQIWTDDMFDNNTVGLTDATDSTLETMHQCLNCQADISPGSEFCTNCGQMLPGHSTPESPVVAGKSGVAATAASLPKGLICGLIGASLGAGIWFAIAYITNYEVGIIACLVGFLAGVGVRFGAQQEKEVLGIMAAVLAIVGILAGKYMLVQYIAIPVAKEMVAEMPLDEIREIARDDDAMYGLVMLNMYNKGRFDDSLAQQLEAYHDGNDVSEENLAQIEQLDSEVQDLLDSLNENEKIKLAREIMTQAITVELNDITFWDMLKESLGVFDILFFLLAIGSAYKIAAGKS